jgi:hypothetical protein
MKIVVTLYNVKDHEAGAKTLKIVAGQIECMNWQDPAAREWTNGMTVYTAQGDKVASIDINLLS